MLVFASWYAGLIASGLSLAGILSVIAAGLHLLRMVNSVHTSHQLRTSQRGGGFSFAGKWSSAHPSGRYGILVRSCILTRSSPIAGGAGWYPAGLRLVACAVLFCY